MSHWGLDVCVSKTIAGLSEYISLCRNLTRYRFQSATPVFHADIEKKKNDRNSGTVKKMLITGHSAEYTEPKEHMMNIHVPYICNCNKVCAGGVPAIHKGQELLDLKRDKEDEEVGKEVEVRNETNAWKIDERKRRWKGVKRTEGDVDKEVQEVVINGGKKRCISGTDEEGGGEISIGGREGRGQERERRKGGKTSETGTSAERH